MGYALGRPFIVMELVDGKNLEVLLTDGPMSEATVARMAINVAGALAAAHRAGLVHRDIKPANIMILREGRAKVIDFGLVTWAADDGGDAVAGSVAYMAPEQTGMLKRVVDGRSDLYALGVTLFRCVTGRLPFMARDSGELMRQHTVVPAPDIRTLCPDVSPVFAAIVSRLLSKDPDHRYQSGEGLAVDLERLLVDGGEKLFQLGSRDASVEVLTSARLVGRDKELSELLVRWDKARTGQGGVALVCGAAGVGKSRLVNEVAAVLGDSGSLVLHGESTPDDAMPLAPLRSALESYLTSINQLPEPARSTARDEVRSAASSMAPLVATLSPALAELLGASQPSGEDRQTQFTTAVATFLVGLGRRAAGAVLWLDDVQWLDPATRRVLRNVAEDLAESRLLIVATARDEGSGAVKEFAADLGDALDTRVQLPPLDDESASQLLADSLGGVAVAPALTRLAARWMATHSPWASIFGPSSTPG